MAEKLTRLIHKIVIQLYLVAESCTNCSSRSRWPVRKLLDTPSYGRLCQITWPFHKNELLPLPHKQPPQTLV